ncbi:hypothetical protein EES47_08910 [Streptomyces sp. ADI98-12]|uniref:Uncharacterized protein n=1 Tax=Streptomyces griseus TaxID=1911 RepID=A0A380P046_STRGR|nr:hypothetical protein [Streptomyces sp. BRB081]MDQ0294682.1 hypothetical protein [Streptomyces sp. DSM 41037]RPK90396.1 hypothetical protein EES47_08910 [Streptomyces sp. ADI98-12]SUP58115.1 Uncharacterised protein [Streptomyces griseus]
MTAALCCRHHPGATRRNRSNARTASAAFPMSVCARATSSSQARQDGGVSRLSLMPLASVNASSGRSFCRRAADSSDPLLGPMIANSVA